MSSQDSGSAASGGRTKEEYVRELEARLAALEAELSSAVILNTLVDNSQDQLVYLDRDFTVVRVNRAYAQTCRRAPEELVGRNHFELYPDAENQAIFERVRDTGEPAVVREKAFTFPDQPERGVTYWDWTLAPVKDATGFVTGLVLSLRDVTEKVRARQQIEESERRFRVMADGAPNIIWVTDADGDLRFANRHYQEFFGVTYEQVEGGKWQPLVHPEDAPGYLDAFRRALRERRPFYAEARVRHADGEWRWITSHAAPRSSSTGEFLGYVGISHDSTDRRRAEEALRESESRFRSILENSLDVAYRGDMLMGRIEYVSPAVLHLYGFAVEELSAMSIEEVRARIHPEDLPRHDAAVEEGLRSGEYRVDYRVRGKDEQYHWIADRAVFLKDEQGRLRYRSGAIHDISERKAAEAALRESERQFRAFFDNVSVGAVQLRPDGRYLRVNDRYCEITGYSREELLAGMHPNELTCPDDQARDRKWIEDVLESRPTPDRIEKRVVRKDGTLIWVQVTANVVRDAAGRVVRSAAIVQDITARKIAEMEREKLVEALRETDRRKNEFMAVLSHELRNPLAPIKSSLYILDRVAPGGEQAHRAQAVINRQVDQLARIVDDLLDVTRISRNKVQLQRQRLELNELVRRTMDDHGSLFEEREIQLQLVPASASVFVNADGNRLAQVVGNLLQNAAKFTGPGGRATVSVAADPDGRHAVLRVADTGIGLTREMLARLFQPFMQADTTLDRNPGGLGLGLALVKDLVELHGGEVTAKSAGPGRGAEFIVRLPLEPPEVAEPAPVRPAAAGTRRRVLIIEDNVDAAETLQDVLEFLEHDVAVAGNGPEGLARARQLRPEIVLCDIGLPGMDGYEVARAFREDPVLRGTYLVALTGYALPDDLQRAREAGFDRHLAKPAGLQKLEELLASAPP